MQEYKPQPPRMTELQAEHEARRRWGARGAAWHPPYAYRGTYGWCLVGTTDGTELQRRWQVLGIGDSWESAFRDADEREHLEHGG